jgi:1-acyl-sn-glycerol-3-phosphate acyltransferase
LSSSVKHQSSDISNQEHSPGKRPVVGIVDYLFSIPFVLSFVGVLCFWDVIQRVATLFGRAAHESVDVLLNRSIVLAMRVAGARVIFENQDQLPETGPLIIVSNHQSLMDVPYLTCLLARFHPKFISKKELTKWLPYVSYALRSGGHGIIDRADPRQSIKEIRRVAADVAASKGAVCIFPEGTRARFGGVGELKARGVLSLLEQLPQAPVVVVSIQNAWKFASRKLMPAPFGIRIIVRVEAVLPAAEHRAKQSLVDEAFLLLEKNVQDRIE